MEAGEPARRRQHAQALHRGPQGRRPSRHRKAACLRSSIVARAVAFRYGSNTLNSAISGDDRLRVQEDPLLFNPLHNAAPPTCRSVAAQRAQHYRWNGFSRRRLNPDHQPHLQCRERKLKLLDP